MRKAMFIDRPELHICRPHLQKVIAEPPHLGQRPGTAGYPM